MENYKQTLQAAIQENNLSVIKIIVEGGAKVGFDEFRLAVSNNAIETVDYFIAKECINNLSREERSRLLVFCVRNGFANMAETLYFVSDIPVDYFIPKSRGYSGSTKERAFIVAIQEGNFEMVKWLRERGARIDRYRLEDENEPPIHTAISSKDKGHKMEIFEYLVGEIIADKKALLNERDKYNNTPLIKAVDSGVFKCVEFLCGCETDLNAVNKNGETAIEVAAKKVYRKESVEVDIVNLLHKKMEEKDLEVNLGQIVFCVYNRHHDDCPIPE